MKKITTLSFLLAILFSLKILTFGVDAKKKKQAAEGSRKFFCIFYSDSICKSKHDDGFH
jgi:hypothetical protein